MAAVHNMGMAHMDREQTVVGSSFDDYVREQEASLAPAQRAALDALRAHYTLAAEVIDLRRRAGMTQMQLAAASGINQSEVSRIERGMANPSQHTLEAIGRVLGMRLGFVPASPEPVAAAG